MHTRQSRFALTSAGLALFCVCAPGWAQTVLDEVVVTAQKREQAAQDVGIAITAFTGSQLKALGVEESVDVAAFSPGVHTSGNIAGQNTQFAIRGVTQNDFNDIIEAPSAVYLDEGYFAIAQAQTFAIFDIDRVEILKGPQGTLFGRNATGGLVQYISNKPSFEEMEGYADVTVGRFDSDADANQVRVEAAIGGPFSETVAGRVAVLYDNHDGYLHNIYPFAAVGGSPGPGAGADMGDDDTVGVRGILQFRPGDDLEWTVSVNNGRSELATGPYQSKPTIAVFDENSELINVIDVGPEETRASIAADGSDFGGDLDNNAVFGDLFGRPAGADFFGYIDPDGEDFDTSGDFAFADQGEIETFGVNNRVEWNRWGSVTLTSVTDFKDYDKLVFIDVDSAPVNQSANYAAVDATSFTQEIRLDGATDDMTWVAGFFYLNIDSESDNGLKFPVGSVVPGAPFDLGVDARLETDSYSLFGQVERDLGDEFTLIAGLRLIQEEKDYVFAQNIYFTQDSRKIHQGPPLTIGPVIVDGTPTPFTDETSDFLWAGKLQLDWAYSDDLLLYLGLNRGVKAGSFNAQLAGGLPVPPSAIPYDEEVLTTLEGGFKATLYGGSTRFNGSFFYYDYADYQAFLFTGVSGVVINADADNYGAELELQTSPVDGLDLLLSAAWFDATVKDVPLRVDGPIRRDVDPTYAPEFQFTGLFRYEWPAFDGSMYVGGDVSYSDEFFYNLRNFDADKFDAYTMVNARIGWINGNENLEVALKMDNVTDERVGIQGFDIATVCGCNEISFQPPRWLGLNLRYSF
ncbi:MAG TPA: TonB-dependent receptor [Woeseiaceae bacterium]|nr:TonB-dependent receptor [Woeseiaceae bacterium]